MQKLMGSHCTAREETSSFSKEDDLSNPPFFSFPTPNHCSYPFEIFNPRFFLLNFLKGLCIKVMPLREKASTVFFLKSSHGTSTVQEPPQQTQSNIGLMHQGEALKGENQPSLIFHKKFSFKLSFYVDRGTKLEVNGFYVKAICR